MEWKFKERDRVPAGTVIATLPANSELCTLELAKITATTCAVCPGHTDSFFLKKLRLIAHCSKVDRYLVWADSGKFLTPRKSSLENCVDNSTR